jgi:hypothetical protein
MLKYLFHRKTKLSATISIMFILYYSSNNQHLILFKFTYNLNNAKSNHVQHNLFNIIDDDPLITISDLFKSDHQMRI